MNHDEIKRAWDRLTPDEETKERMLSAILEKSAAMEQETSAKPVGMPWYVRLRIPMGVSAAAMACAVIVTLAVGNPLLVNNGSSRQELLGTQPVSGMHTTEPVVSAYTGTCAADADTEAAWASVTTQTTSLTTVTTDLTETSLDIFLKEGGAVLETSASQKPMVSAVVTTPTEMPAASSDTTAAPVTTLTTVTEMTETQTSLTETAEQTTTKTNPPSLYGNLYDFNHVSWAGLSYDTSYETVAYEDLENHLGSGVAVGDTVGGSYTILLYEIHGMPVERGLAVQYAGQNEYYLFYCVG